MMKKKITTLFVGIFTIILTAHAQVAPTVSFVASSQTVCAGSCITFTNATTGSTPILLTWYFPGSNTPKWSGPSTTNPPCITYLYPGTYNVSCVASNGTLPNDSVCNTNYIVVMPLPTAYISPPSGGICDTGTQGGGAVLSVDDTIQFSISDTIAGCTYSWAPGTGISCTTCRNPKVYPYNNTVYTLTVTGPDGCVATYTAAVTVGSISAQITGQTNTLCAGLNDVLTASGGSTNPATVYRWNNGATTSSITVNPTTTTTYSVLIVSGTGACTANASYLVNVSPIPHFTITSPDSICYSGPSSSATVNLSPPMGNPYAYTWYGPPFGAEDTDVLTVSPSTTTIYTLVVQNNFCYYDTTVKIKVNTPPVITFTGPSNLCLGATGTICATGGDQYTWSTGQTTSCINVLPPASINYTVQVRNGACFKDTFFFIAVDSMPTVLLKGDTSICTGDSTFIYTTDKQGGEGYEYSYLWNTGATTDTVFVGYGDGGSLAGGIYTYYVTVTKGACSVDSSEIKVKVYQHPKPALYPIDTTVCEYDSVQLTAAGGDYYQWSPKNSGLNHYLGYGDTDRNNAAPFVTTMYTVNVCTWGCCKDTSVVINITPNVQGATVCCNATVGAGVPVQLSATYTPGPYFIEGWTPASGLSCTTCANPVATVNNTTTYVATFADNNGCIVQDSVTIDIFNCNVFVPNIFSPGQEVNNILYVRSLCLQNMDFAVFDRFGNKVFETQNINDGWDGTYKGKPMNVGTYMWYLTGLLQDGTDISKSGNVTLIR